MPGTYAAVAASLNALMEIDPDFAPLSLLDIGAGPGTATWAASEAFTSLETFTLLDANTALRDLATDLVTSQPRLETLRYDAGDARKALADATEADLVVASYVINELSESERAAFADTLWAKTRNILLVVEPGTPAGYSHHRVARPAGRTRRICHCALPARRSVSTDRTGLVPFHATAAAIACA
jgi:ribosomal protein RSM22 (predicted rRNA methylase)